MRKVILTLLSILSFSIVIAQDFKVNINKLTEETQQLSESPDKMKLVWWVPTDFWKAVFDQDKNLPKDQADLMLSQLEKYTMVVTVDGEIDANGDVSYRTSDEIFKDLKVVDDKSKEYKPLLYEEIDLDTQQLIGVMKPVLGQMLGKVGENMHFFLFQKRDDPLNKIVDPLQSESFVVELTKEKFKWNLPLSSLLKPKKCTVCNEYHEGSWTYCPYNGNKLVDN